MKIARETECVLLSGEHLLVYFISNHNSQVHSIPSIMVVEGAPGTHWRVGSPQGLYERKASAVEYVVLLRIEKQRRGRAFH